MQHFGQISYLFWYNRQQYSLFSFVFMVIWYPSRSQHHATYLLDSCVLKHQTSPFIHLLLSKRWIHLKLELLSMDHIQKEAPTGMIACFKSKSKCSVFTVIVEKGGGQTEQNSIWYKQSHNKYTNTWGQ